MWKLGTGGRLLHLYTCDAAAHVSTCILASGGKIRIPNEDTRA